MTITTLNNIVWRLDPCTECRGYGFHNEQGRGWEGTHRTCRACQGKGYIRSRIGQTTTQVTTP